MKDVDLKELGYFRAVAEAGTICKAAARLRVAQPALSRRMRQLEHRLGVQLLQRSPRGVTPTSAGAMLLERTRHLEQEIAETCRAVSGCASEVGGSLAIAVQYPLSTLLMPQLVKAYRGACPAVSLHIVDGYSGGITDALLDERIDLAIVDPPSHEPAGLAIIPLWTEELMLVGPVSERTAGPIPLAEVALLPLILPSVHHALRKLVDAAFARHHLKIVPTIEADGQLLILELVKAGLGFTLFPKSVFHTLERSGDVSTRTLTTPIRRTAAIVTRTALLGDLKVANLIGIIHQLIPALVLSDRFGPAALYDHL